MITNSKGEVLLAQRSLKKDKDPGVWGPAAAGTVDEGETYEANAYKELEEEVGITGVKLTPGKVRYFEHPLKQFAKWYFGTIDVETKDLVLQETEVEAVRWITVEELLKELEKTPDSYVPMMSVGMKLIGY